MNSRVDDLLGSPCSPTNQHMGIMVSITEGYAGR